MSAFRAVLPEEERQEVAEFLHEVLVWFFSILHYFNILSSIGKSGLGTKLLFRPFLLRFGLYKCRPFRSPVAQR